jgi:hypothetical protein
VGLDYFALRLTATFFAAFEARFTSLCFATGEDFIVRTVMA